MNDISTIGAILGSVKTAAEIAKLLKDTSLSLEQAEIKLKLAELLGALADAKIETADIQSLIADKDKRIEELEKKLKISAAVIYEKPYYWLMEGNKKDGPYCQRCYDTDRLLVRLQESGNGCWDCRACKSIYTDSSHIPDEPIVYSRGGSDWSGY